MTASTRLRGILFGALLGLTPAATVYSAPQAPRVVEGDGSRSGGYFTAGSQGARIAIPGGASLRLEPGASVRVFSRAQRLRMPSGYATHTWSVAVRRGRVSAEVTKPRQSAVLLVASTKFSLVVAEGTGSLFVSTEETAAVNHRGRSHAIVDGRWSPLSEAAILSVDAKGTVKSEHTPSAPEVDAGQRLWVSTGAPINMEGIRWTPVVGAEKYEVALYQSGDDEPLLEQVTNKPELEVPFRPLGGGDFELAVRAVDRRGVLGAWSKRVALRVVGVALPEGAYVSSGSIHLGQGQKARFTHTEGLVLTHSGVRRYLPASSLVPLHQNSRTMVSFRLPGTANLAITEMLPRPVRAEIEIGPKRARWPEDEVTVSVALTPTGPGAVPISIEPRPRVMIGIDPVDLEWHKKGNRLEAVVPPSSEKGPWVVRVEVEDQYGVPLGRDFLEIATNEARR